PPAGGPSGAPAGGPRTVPPKPPHPPGVSRSHQSGYVPGDGMLAWLPFRPTIRMRLTLLYGGMFLMAGLVLLLLMYVFFQDAVSFLQPRQSDFNGNFVKVSGPNGTSTAMNSAQFNDYQASDYLARSDSALNTLLRKSLTMLVCLAVIAFAAGYAMAGRV